MNTRGATLLEATFAIGLSAVILAVGYQTYSVVMRMDEVESRRQALTLNAQNLMRKVKQDVRAGSSVSGSTGTLTINGPDGRVTYMNAPGRSGVRRTTRYGPSVYQGLRADFSFSGGVNVRIHGEQTVRKRKVNVDISSYVRPRNG